MVQISGVVAIDCKAPGVAILAVLVLMRWQCLNCKIRENREKRLGRGWLCKEGQ